MAELLPAQLLIIIDITIIQLDYSLDYSTVTVTSLESRSTHLVSITDVGLKQVQISITQ